MPRRPSAPALFDLADLGPDFSFEDRARKRGAARVAGIDEAGRGPLAGPVVVAAVVLDRRRVPKGLDDSKALTAARREKLYAEIMRVADVGITLVSPATIDRRNILAATLAGMAEAANALALPPDFALIDGRDVPSGLPCPGEAVVKGDARSRSIAAASIIAKVTRDRLMTAMDELYPAYGFARHMGYGTAAHLEALRAHGPCPLHRFSFAPVRDAAGAIPR
ncbi:MAG: ribonuclease HII [Hyphomicrobiaceae bacterium]|nr:ribonuclease HII [Hyphomicrobiaceae bacterium]